MIGISVRALGQELFSTSSHPTLIAWVNTFHETSFRAGVRFVFRIVEDPLLVALNVNLETGFDELAGRGGSQSCSVLERLRLTT